MSDKPEEKAGSTPEQSDVLGGYANTFLDECGNILDSEGNIINPCEPTNLPAEERPTKEVTLDQVCTTDMFTAFTDKQPEDHSR